MHPLSKPELIVSWICRVVAAVILLQTLYFKFTGAPESVYIFTKVGLEPWGRIGSGVVELIAAVLILWPGLNWLGAGIALGLLAALPKLFRQRREITALRREREAGRREAEAQSLTPR